MKIEKLTIEHLAPYLPYGVKAKTKRSEFIVVGAHDYTIFGDNENGEMEEYYEDVKPILRPLSDLTKEIEHSGERFAPVDWIRENLDYDEYSIDYYINHTERLPYEIVQKLFEWHFDVSRLIEKGLAIDINTLNK